MWEGEAERQHGGKYAAEVAGRVGLVTTLRLQNGYGRSSTGDQLAGVSRGPTVAVTSEDVFTTWVEGRHPEGVQQAARSPSRGEAAMSPRGVPPDTADAATAGSSAIGSSAAQSDSEFVAGSSTAPLAHAAPTIVRDSVPATSPPAEGGVTEDESMYDDIEMLDDVTIRPEDESEPGGRSHVHSDRKPHGTRKPRKRASHHSGGSAGAKKHRPGRDRRDREGTA